MNDVQFDSDSNIPDTIRAKMTRKLHNVENHPIEIIKRKIFAYFKSLGHFETFDNLNQIVSTTDCFDNLLVPPDHVSRSRSDTYYATKDTLLRSHMTAHDNQLLAAGHRNFVSAGDVYRKDEIDRCHYPVFHQIDGVGEVPEGNDPNNAVEFLIKVLTGLVDWLFPGKKSEPNRLVPFFAQKLKVIPRLSVPCK